jgi:DNA-binding transcriptional ArsR family regulator
MLAKNPLQQYLCIMTTLKRPTEGIRHVDMTGLKALAHPLRVRILDTLSTYGSFTASGLAERLGESSGSTSYHLRQLEKHGFVREDTARGSGRERWWERTPDGITIIPTDFEPRSAGRAASELITREWQVSRDALLGDFLQHGSTRLEKRWFEASTLNTLNLRLTSEQLEQLVAELETVTERYAKLYKKSDVPGSRPVQIQVNAFPVMDADEVPDPGSDVGGRV